MPLAETRMATIHNVEVKQTKLQGKWYTPVDGRVKIAEQADPSLIRRKGSGYHVVEMKIMQIGDRWAYHCMVEYPIGSGVVKPGSDFIDMKDNTGLAKAETSAIGRALGLHGIAIEESIASLDEMANVPAFADELDEGERVVDAPVEGKKADNKKPTPIRSQQQQHTASAAPQAKPAPAASQEAQQEAALTPEQYVKTFIQTHKISTLAMTSFVSRENLTREWDVLAAALRNPEKAAHCCVTSWTMAHKFTMNQMVTFMTQEKMSTYQKVWTALQKDDRDIIAALQ